MDYRDEMRRLINLVENAVQVEAEMKSHKIPAERKAGRETEWACVDEETGEILSLHDSESEAHQHCGKHSGHVEVHEVYK